MTVETAEHDTNFVILLVFCLVLTRSSLTAGAEAAIGACPLLLQRVRSPLGGTGGCLLAWSAILIMNLQQCDLAAGAGPPCASDGYRRQGAGVTLLVTLGKKGASNDLFRSRVERSLVVEQLELEAFDTDGDGHREHGGKVPGLYVPVRMSIFSRWSLRLSRTAWVGIGYAGACGEANNSYSPIGSMGAGEDLASDYRPGGGCSNMMANRER